MLDRIRKQKQDNTCSRYLGTFKEKEPESLLKGTREPFHRDPGPFEGLLKVTW